MVTTISRETMRQIERSVGNVKARKVVGPINIKAARKISSSFPARKKRKPGQQ